MKEKREFSPLMMLLAMLLLLCILFLYGLVQSGEKEKAIQEKELALSNVELDYREILISEWNGRYRYAVSEQGDQIYISGISSGEDGYSDPGDLSRSSDLPGSSVQLESEDIFFHNNGNPIIPTNIFKNDENEGNYLIAVYISEINGTVFCQALFPKKSVKIPCFRQGIFPSFGGTDYASLRMRACSIR